MKKYIYLFLIYSHSQFLNISPRVHNACIESCTHHIERSCGLSCSEKENANSKTLAAFKEHCFIKNDKGVQHYCSKHDLRGRSTNPTQLGFQRAVLNACLAGGKTAGRNACTLGSTAYRKMTGKEM